MAIEAISGLEANRTPDLVLVNSPLRNYDLRPKDDYEVLPPLGLAYIATLVNSKGYNVGVLDAEHQGIGQKRLASILNEQQARYVGVNVLTPTLNESLHIAGELDENISLVIGGPHATAKPAETLQKFIEKHRNTILVANEGEFPIASLLDGQPVESVSNTYWVDRDGQIQSNKSLIVSNLDAIPALNRGFLANDPSIDDKTGKTESRVLTSRGCPFNCTFCAGARESNPLNVVRSRSPEKIADEIKDLVTNHGCGQIRFIDDLFISSEKRVRSIIEAMKQVGVNNITWDATGRANILARFSPDFLDYLKDNGAHEIAIGIESGSERLRQRINKEVTVDQINTSITELTKRGIHVKGYFIIGLPSETKEETMETIRMAQNLTEKSGALFRASIFIFRPYPATQDWNTLVSSGYSEEELMSMHAAGIGSRAKHEITTSQQFGENSPVELSKLLTYYNDWQNGYYQAHTYEHK